MQNVYCKGDWFDLICRSYRKNGCSYEGHTLPGFPDDDTQIRTTGRSGYDNLCEAFIFYEDCIGLFSQSGNFNCDDKVVMDFGVGWGRILRFFLKHFKPENLIGVDINDGLLDICRSTFNYGRFVKSSAMPPVDFDDESIDYVVGYSVFSHLSEEACNAWIQEFSRILRPGGIVALTTRGRWFFDYCKSLKSKNGYSGALGDMFDDFNKAREQYDRGELVHGSGDGISGNGPLNAAFYGETFIPEAYARKKFSHYLEFVQFMFVPGRQTHPIMFFRKPE